MKFNSILIVDGEESVRVTLELSLVNKGYRIKTVATGGDAVDELDRNDYDIVLTDVVMQGGDGVSLSTWVRREHPTIDVIIMTDLASVEIAADAVRAGALDYLFKPFPDIGLVVATVQRALEKQQRQSELRQTTEELRKSEQLYRLLTENMSDVVWTMDMNLRNTYMSPSVQRMRGYTVSEAIMQRIDELLTPASIKVALKVFEEELSLELMEDKDTSRFQMIELEVTCKDGSTKWAEVRMMFMRDEEGRATGILGITHDITERRQAEEALRFSEERFRTIFEHAPDAYFLNDLSGRFIDCNLAAEKLTGYDKAELLGRNWMEVDLLLRDQILIMAELLKQCAQGVDVSPAIVVFNNKDGSRKRVEIRAHLVILAGEQMSFTTGREIIDALP
ncbi:MAG: PAS domain S-box protein [Deltaproteobacteria bacterium]|nr:PAS domain S-box protein [Deltaproteobacteria bacterium]